ncbi:MAG: SO_0444 family Cu/Zn efflux transporter, partial [Phycisphaerales bacterium]
LGLVFAGLVRSLLPGDFLTRLIGRSGVGGVVKAALFGAPLPLCSCGVLPTAIGLRRQGLSKPATVSFLIATPQNGVDSLAISYSLLGLPFTIARLMCSLLSAVVAGLCTHLVTRREVLESSDDDGQTLPACCVGKTVQTGPPVASCCDPVEQPAGPSQIATDARPSVIEGQRYAFGKLFRDLSFWLLIGIVVAGVLNALVSPQALGQHATGIVAMLLILLVSIPMYICATASTPIAAAMLAAGVGPGPVLVFLLAGPATNFGSIMLVRAEIGTRATAAYLSGLIVSTIACGLLLDRLWPRLGAGDGEGAAGAVHLVPHWLAVGSAMLLTGLFIWQRTAWTREPGRGSRAPVETSLQSPAAAPQS